MFQIVIADDNTLFSHGLKQILSFEKEFQILSLVKSESDLFSIVRTFPVDLIIMDIRTPALDGINVCKKLRNLYPKVKIIGISMFEDFKLASELKQIGVQGYLFKTLESDDLVKYIIQIAHGKMVFPEIIQTNSVDQGDEMPQAISSPSLSDREKQIVGLIADGHNSNGIAAKLFISINTVKNHRKNILRKMRVNNVQELLAYAIFHHII